LLDRLRGNLSDMSAETPLLAFFTEPRSGPARRMESLIAHLARKERGRLRVARVDVAETPDVAERLNVDTVPTLLLIKDKRIVGRLEGRASAPRIERMLDQHLEPVETGA
jgi:thioredoxin-like negative regulator of GroEL